MISINDMITQAKRLVLHLIESAGYRLIKRSDLESKAAAPPTTPLSALPQSQPRPEFVEWSGNAATARAVALPSVVRYLIGSKIPGGVVDCGHGDPAALAALATMFLQFGDPSRRLILFDTTADPLHRAEIDLKPWGTAREPLSAPARIRADRKPEPPPTELIATGYPADNITVGRYPREPIVGDGEIAFLGLMSETYDANRSAVAAFFPRVSKGGVIAIQGKYLEAPGRGAFDEYLVREGLDLLLVPVAEDYRIGVKL
jgi:hypothetical protein